MDTRRPWGFRGGFLLRSALRHRALGEIRPSADLKACAIRAPLHVVHLQIFQLFFFTNICRLLSSTAICVCSTGFQMKGGKIADLEIRKGKF